MKKKDERIIPASDFPDPDELMPTPKHRKAEMLKENADPLKTEELVDKVVSLLKPETKDDIKDTSRERAHINKVITGGK